MEPLELPERLGVVGSGVDHLDTAVGEPPLEQDLHACSRPVKHRPLSLSSCRGSPCCAEAVVNASHAVSPVASVKAVAPIRNGRGRQADQSPRPVSYPRAAPWSRRSAAGSFDASRFEAACLPAAIWCTCGATKKFRRST